MFGKSVKLYSSDSILKLCFLSIMLLCLNDVLSANAQDQDFEEIFRTCVEKNPINEDDLKNFSPGPDSKSEVLSFFKCVLEHSGYIDGEGKLDVDKMKADDFVYESEPGADYDCMAKVESVKESSDMVEVLKCVNPKVFSQG